MQLGVNACGISIAEFVQFVASRYQMVFAKSIAEQRTVITQLLRLTDTIQCWSWDLPEQPIVSAGAPMTDTNELSLHAEFPSLRVDEGIIRVGKSRISLDLVVEQYENGMTPDDLVRIRVKIEEERPRITREQLLARRRVSEKADASTGGCCNFERIGASR